MEPQVEIYINSGDTLDVNMDFGMGITYSIDDIRNIEKRNSSFTKTIKLPGTKKNNYLLGNLFDINASYDGFNPNIKTSCQLIRNGTVVLDGFLQLRKIIKHNEVDLEGNFIEYDVTINETSIDFFTIIKNKDLNELDFSDYNHDYDKSTIVNSWSNDWKDVYTYPLTFNGNNDFEAGSNTWDITDLKPMIFHKAYLNKIAEDAGFELGGDFWNDHPDYEKSVIPFNGEDSQIKSTNPIFDSEFRAGLINNNYRVVQAQYNTQNFSVDNFFQNNKRIVPFDDDTNSPNFDNNNNFYAGDINRQWDTTNNPAPFPFTLDSEFTIDVIFSGIDSCGLYSTSNSYGLGPNNTNVTVDMVYTLRTIPNNVQVGLEVRDVDIFNQQFPVNLSVGQVFSASSTVSGFFLNNQIVSNNQKLRIVAELDFVHNDELIFYKYSGPYNIVGRVYLEVNFKKSSSTGSLTKLQNNIELTNSLLEFTEVDLNTTIPLKVSQSIIVSDLIKRYNLYITDDPDNNKKLLLYTRNQFYSGGTTEDWTDKLDYDSPLEIEFLPELQNKKVLYTYKLDSDNANKDYKERTEDIYGQKRIIFENEFIKGEKKVESPMSSTPLIKNKNTDPVVIVPAILSNDPKNKIRVLHYGGLINTISNFMTGAGEWTLTSEGGTVSNQYTTYPYAGHFDNPFEPNMDLNYGNTDFLYYRDTLSGTTNNLFNNYFRNQVEQISEGKLVTAMFNLNETDINFIRNNMNTKIQLYNSFYYINKIVDYNPTKNQLTKVELLKIIDGVSFTGERKKLTTIITPGIAISEYVSVINLGGSGGGTTATNTSSSDESVMVGRSNVIGQDSEKTMIIGDNNLIDSRVKESGILGGSNNIIRSGVKNSWIIGTSGKTITKSNEIWIGNLNIVDGETKSNLNVIDGGLNEVSNRYPSDLRNTIDGGLNEVRTFSSESVENLIDGGLDSL